MPIFSSQLGKIESQNTEQSIKVMANHLRKIQEELEYRLMHLDSSNVSDIDASQTNVLVGGKPIQNVLQDNNGNLSALQQAADKLTATVQNLETGMAHMLKLDATGVYIVDSTGKQVTIQSGQINAEGLTVNAANITGTLKVGVIPSSIARTSDLAGMVTEDNVTTITHNAISTASISANQITSGTLNASYVKVKGLLQILSGGSTYGWVGGSDMGTTAGAVLTGPSTMHGCMATNTGAKLVYNINEHMIWVAEDGCSSTSAMKVFSDSRLKEDICYDLGDAEKMFEKLRACSFYMKQDKNKKKSWGFIAQHAIAAAEEAGMDTAKMAMFGSYEGMHTIAYGEMTALNTHMIQKLMQRVAALEEANA